MPEQRGKLKANLASLALGASAVFCFAPAEAFWLAPLVCAALFLLWRESASPRIAAWRGFHFGLGFFLGGVSWVYVSLSVFGGMPDWLAGGATLAFCAALALYPAVLGALFKRWQPANPWQQAAYFAALLAAGDWLRGTLFTGFPWLALGYSQTPPSPLAGYAPIIGVYGISLLLGLCGALLALRQIKSWLLALAILSGGWGLHTINWTESSAPPIEVALLQGNVPQDMKFRPEVFRETLALYQAMVEASAPAHLVVLPETAFPAFLEQIPPSYLNHLQQIMAKRGGNLIAGLITGDGTQYYNSAISLGKAPSQTYSKHHLVPFGEFMPPGFAWFMAYAHIPASSFSRGGEAQAPLNLGGTRIGLNICYEDVFGGEIIRALPQAEILANLSNTAWFGRSLAQPQHLQIARLRAMETGRPMLRATNTGITAIINARGDIQAQLPAFSRGILRGAVSPRRGETPYTQYGDRLAAGLWLALLLAGLLRKSSNSSNISK